MEEGILICSGPGMAERRIPMADVLGLLGNAHDDAPQVFRLMIKGGGTIDLQDPKGELKNLLAGLRDDFVQLDDLWKSKGLIHEDERLGRFVHSCGSWHLDATVDLPFQADVPISFEVELDTPRLPGSMRENVLWIQDNLGEIWNAAARLINALVEAEGISAPERFSLRHLWANIPDAALDAADWRFTVEIEDMYESFEVNFHGLEPVSCNAA
jgi:hypothetical protein